MLRALPLKPTKGSAFGNRKLLKKLEQKLLNVLEKSVS